MWLLASPGWSSRGWYTVSGSIRTSPFSPHCSQTIVLPEKTQVFHLPSHWPDSLKGLCRYNSRASSSPCAWDADMILLLCHCATCFARMLHNLISYHSFQSMPFSPGNMAWDGHGWTGDDRTWFGSASCKIHYSCTSC